MREGHCTQVGEAKMGVARERCLAGRQGRSSGIPKLHTYSYHSSPLPLPQSHPHIVDREAGHLCVGGGGVGVGAESRRKSRRDAQRQQAAGGCQFCHLSSQQRSAAQRTMSCCSTTDDTYMEQPSARSAVSTAGVATPTTAAVGAARGGHAEGRRVVSSGGEEAHWRRPARAGLGGGGQWRSTAKRSRAGGWGPVPGVAPNTAPLPSAAPRHGPPACSLMPFISAPASGSPCLMRCATSAATPAQRAQQAAVTGGRVGAQQAGCRAPCWLPLARLRNSGCLQPKPRYPSPSPVSPAFPPRSTPAPRECPTSSTP